MMDKELIRLSLLSAKAATLRNPSDLEQRIIELRGDDLPLKDAPPNRPVRYVTHEHNHGRTMKYPEQRKKLGRNDPCPCGSGKKFKACCIRKRQ